MLSNKADHASIELEIHPIEIVQDAQVIDLGGRHWLRIVRWRQRALLEMAERIEGDGPTNELAEETIIDFVFNCGITVGGANVWRIGGGVCGKLEAQALKGAELGGDVDGTEQLVDAREINAPHAMTAVESILEGKQEGDGDIGDVVIRHVKRLWQALKGEMVVGKGERRVDGISALGEVLAAEGQDSLGQSRVVESHERHRVREDAAAVGWVRRTAHEGLAVDDAALEGKEHGAGIKDEVTIYE